MLQLHRKPTPIDGPSAYSRADTGVNARRDPAPSAPDLPPVSTFESVPLAPANPIPTPPPASPRAAPDNSRAALGPVPKGIEVEFTALALSDASQAVAHVLQGTPVADATWDVFDHKHGRWEVKDDAGNGEIASPILRTTSDLRRMLHVIRELRGAGATTDTGTGLHIHVDGKTFSPAQVVRLVILMAKYEPVIYNVFGVDFERQRIFCRPLSAHLAASFARSQPTTEADLLSAYLQGGSPNRYFGVNLTNRVPIPDASQKCTIEFRYFDSDLDERVTDDIATMVEHICTWALHGESNIDAFGANPEDFCSILQVSLGSPLHARIMAGQSNWPLFDAMKSMSLADLDIYSRRLNASVAAHAVRQMGRFGKAGLELAKLASDDGNTLINGAARAACAEVIESLSFEELERYVVDPTPFVSMQALYRMHTALYALSYADALNLCQGSTSRRLLMRRLCGDALSSQSTAAILRLLDDATVVPTESDLETMVFINPRVSDPATLTCLWRIHSLPQLSEGGRVAVLQMLLQSEPLERWSPYVDTLSGWGRLRFMNDLRVAGSNVPDTVRAILTKLTQDSLLKIQVCALGYLREMA